MQYAYFKSPIGLLELSGDDQNIHKIRFVNEKQKQARALAPAFKRGVQQLKEYFSGRRKKFELNLDFVGTDFQKAVWKAMNKIPYGKTVSYGDIANQIKNPKAVRAVGQACNKNPIGIIGPCHRVVGKNGKLTGYATGLDRKAWLLEHEKRNG